MTRAQRTLLAHFEILSQMAKEMAEGDYTDAAKKRVAARAEEARAALKECKR